MPKFDWFRPFLTSEGGTSLGSGFIVQTEPYLLIATNQHVINDAISVKIQLLLHSEKKWPVNVVAACPKFDLALLTLKDDAGFKEVLKKANIEPKALPLSEEVAQMGEDVVALGFPLGQTSLKISKGNVAGNEVVNHNLCIQSTAPISPGNSGGPLLNADGTTIVGVNFAGATSGENINYVIPAWRVRALVNKHLKDQPSVPKDGAWKRLGFKTADHGLLTQQPNAALYEASHGCKKGVFVGRVQDGFMAQAKPKVKAGSMLVSVNGRELDVFGTTPIKDLMMGRAHLDDLFFIKPNLEEEVPFTTCFHGKEVEHHVNTSWTKKNDRGINYIDEPVIDERDKNYEMFGDIGVMDMTVNHVAEAMKRSGSAQIARWLLPDRITEPRLMVIYVRPGSYATEVLPEGAGVEKLNGKKVRTLDEWREALVPEEGKIWTLETDLGVVVASPFEKTLTDQLKRSVGQPYLLTKGAQEAAQKLGFLKEVDGSEDKDGDEEEEVSNETVASNETEASNETVGSNETVEDPCWKTVGQGRCPSGFYKKLGNKIGRDTVTELWPEGVDKTPASCMAYCRGERICKGITFGVGPVCTLFSRECKKPLEDSGDDDFASYKKMDEETCAKVKEANKAKKAAKAKAEQKHDDKKEDDGDEQDSEVATKSDDQKDADVADWSDDYVKDGDAKSGTFFSRWFGWFMHKPKKSHGQATVLLQGSAKNARSHSEASMAALQAAGPLQVEVGPRGGLVARSSRVAHADEIAAMVTGTV